MNKLRPQIPPRRIKGRNHLKLPIPSPSLYLPLAMFGLFGIFANLKVNQLVQAIFSAKGGASKYLTRMLPPPTHQLSGRAVVQKAVPRVAHNIKGVLSHD